MRRLKGYIPEESLPGVTTVVTDKSKSDLPNDSDREKETNLPPGAATPKTVKKDDSADGNGRHLKQPAYNGPGTGEPGPAEHPRTLPTPGEEAGSPTKYDYNMPTRRSMEGSDKEAYKARIPWKRQKRQRTWKKLKDKQYYQRNKSRIKQRLRIWYKSVRNNQNYQTQKEKRRENPERYERRKVGADHPLAREIIATLMREGYTPWSMGQRRHKHRGPELQKRRREYRKNRARAKVKHRLWYQKNKNKPAFKRRQKMRRQNPSRFRMRPASVLTAPEIAFVVGRDMRIGYVHSVSPMTGLVTMVLTGPVVGGSSMFSMPTMAFLNSVVFLSDEDTDAMFELIDVEVGESAYADLRPEGLRQCASLYGISPDSDEFKNVCLRLGEVEDVETASPAILAHISSSIVEESMRYWGERSTFDPEDEFQEDLLDPTDDNYYYGEVIHPGDPFAGMGARVASRWLKQAGELGLIERQSPDEWERPVYNSRPERPVGPGQWTKTDPSPTHDPTPSDYVPPNEADFPAGSGKVIPEHLKHASVSPERLFKGLRTPESDFDLGLWLGEETGYSTTWYLGWWDYEWDMMGGVLGEGGDHGDPEIAIAERVALANGAERVRDRLGMPRLEWESKTKAVKAAQQIIREIQAYRRSHSKTAATMADLTNRTSGEVTKRSKGVQVRLSRADPSKGIWTFKASGSGGKAYTIRLKAEAKGNVKEVQKAQIRVSCDCDFFRWQGPEHWARTNGYLYGKPRGTASAPTEKDPKGDHWMCKHVAAALRMAQKYRLAGNEHIFPLGAEIVPDGYGGPSGG